MAETSPRGTRWCCPNCNDAVRLVRVERGVRRWVCYNCNWGQMIAPDPIPHDTHTKRGPDAER